MASLWIASEPSSCIDYYMNGEIWCFELRGKVLLNKKEGIEVGGWKRELYRFIKVQGLDIDDGRGLHAFVYKFLEENYPRH